jgi:hypothetical protein
MNPKEHIVALANKLAWKCNGVEPRVARLALAIVMTLVIRSEKGPKAAARFKEVMSEYFQKESAS